MATSNGRATLEVALIVVIVFIAQMVFLFFGLGFELFALAAPLTINPWTIVTSVYAHGSLGHLLANLVALVIFGFVVERRSTRLRFHAFVLSTGALAGIAEIVVGGLVGPSPLVLGISGAVFALMGYVVTSNPVADSMLGWLELDSRIQIVLMIILAVGITWITRGERVALIAHFTGFLLGLLAGRAHLLRA